MATIDSYPTSNIDSITGATYTPSTSEAYGACFTGDGQKIVSTSWYLTRIGVPGGNLVSKIYAMTGTFGVNGNVGTLLATSDNLAVTSVSTSGGLVTFTFSGANQFVTVNGTHYVVTMETQGLAGATNGDAVKVSYDASSPTHPGTWVFRNASVWNSADAGIDMVFYVDGAPVNVTVNLTGVAATPTVGTGTVNIASAGLAAGLISYWKLDETSGTRVDSVGTNHLTDNNSVGSATGKIGNAANFVVASSQYLASGLFNIVDVFSVSLWFKVANTTGDYMGMFSYRMNDSGMIEIYVNPSMKSAVYVYGATGSPNGTFDGTGTFGTFATNTWYHYVVTWDSSGTLSCYINNTLDKTVATGGGPLGTMLDALNIGKDSVGSARYVDGLVDEVGLWQRALTTTEITELYNSGAGKTYPFVSDVTVNLTGVSASPAVGTGTVTIVTAVTPPPVGAGGGTGRSGMRLRPAEDIRLYLEGVAADPKVGTVVPLNDMARVYEGYLAPARARKPAEMPPGMRRVFEKPIPPAIFVYPTPFPRLKGAVGTGKVTAYFEDIDEELMALVGIL